jgi:hypothetical protein
VALIAAAGLSPPKKIKKKKRKKYIQIKNNIKEEQK